MTHTIEYRSVDRAGSEEEVRSVQVTTDTTRQRAGGFPGPVLPPSPVVGALGDWGMISFRTYQ